MNILKKIFHKHIVEEVKCPFTLMTYSMCTVCEKRLAARSTVNE